MKKKIEICILRQKHPEWTLQQIGDKVKATREYVRQCLVRAGIRTSAHRGVSLAQPFVGACVWCGKKQTKNSHWNSLCRPCLSRRLQLQASAYQMVNKAVKEGKLPPISSRQCVDCGKPAVNYDHRDYCRPLDVEPVCVRCNSVRGRAGNPLLP